MTEKINFYERERTLRMGITLSNGNGSLINSNNFQSAFDKAPAVINITPEDCKQVSVDEKFAGTYRKNSMNYQPHARDAILYGKATLGIEREISSDHWGFKIAA